MNAFDKVILFSNRVGDTMSIESCKSLGDFLNKNQNIANALMTGKRILISSQNKWILTTPNMSLYDAMISLNNCA